MDKQNENIVNKLEINGVSAKNSTKNIPVCYGTSSQMITKIFLTLIPRH